MARPKKLGEAIHFRLPLANGEDAAFREAAERAGLSPGEYARKLISLDVSQYI
jgi:hypothetical protein